MTTPHQAVRTLASPGFVLALVVLVLNDHVLKQAYPGWVTGKLSDVAGLVVAPLLLAVPLTLLRVPRALLVSMALTGLGFTLTKTSAAGAATTSDLWSLTGIPTHIRADVTDLLALPALYAAWLVHRRVVGRQPADWRSAVALATGAGHAPPDGAEHGRDVVRRARHGAVRGPRHHAVHAVRQDEGDAAGGEHRLSPRRCHSTQRGGSPA